MTAAAFHWQSNCHDSARALPLLDAIPPLQGVIGRALVPIAY